MSDIFIWMVMGGLTGLGFGFLTGLVWAFVVVNGLTGGKLESNDE